VTSGEITQAKFKYQIAKSPRNPPPSLRSPHSNSDIHGDVNKKRENRRGFQLKRQSKQQTATAAAALETAQD
jgi:hypothetical protein